MTRLRSALFVLWMYLGMVAIGLVFLPTLVLPGPLAWVAVRLWTRYMLFGLRWICGVRVVRRGAALMPDTPILWAGKHQAMLDVLIPFLMRRRPVIILKKELLWYPVFGWYALRVGCIPIDRSGSAAALKDMVRRAKTAIASGRDVVIFPEGTRMAPGAAPAYKPGVDALYRALDVPCVPVATNAGMSWPARGLTRTPGQIVYEALAPIPPGLKRKDFAVQLQTVVEAASTRLIEAEMIRRTGDRHSGR